MSHSTIGQLGLNSVFDMFPTPRGRPRTGRVEVINLLQYQSVPDWPALSWLVRLDDGSQAARVYHGAHVETRDDWFCEAVWAGEFAGGDFDRTDIVAGSGGRLRQGQLVFVSSGSTVDRLQFLRSAHSTWISNSLVCLLAAVGGSVDPSYPRYFRDLRSIAEGLDKYRRVLVTSAGKVEFRFFDNLVWDGRRFTEVAKPASCADLESFDDYRGFLDRSLAQLAENARDARRQRTYRLLGALSSGYDSVTVTALASRHGCRHALCVERARDGSDDSGIPIAPYLGVEVLQVAGDGWRAESQPEAEFIAANACGEEVYLRSAEEHLAGSVLLSGYFGDQVWSKTPRDPGPNLTWGEHGLSLTEFRLRAGFLHCPPTFWGARELRRIHAISTSSEMRPWDVPGNYSRPICRRIAEEAGVPRELFGQSKRAVAVLMHFHDFLSPSSLSDYLGYLSRNRGAWLRRGRLPPVPSRHFDSVVRTAVNLCWWLARRVGWRSLAARLLEPVHLRSYVFPWALEHAKQAYPQSPDGVAPGGSAPGGSAPSGSAPGTTPSA